MRRLCISILALVALGWAGASVGWAQAPSNGASGNAQRLQWPRTFTGQPDFAFTREEALQEAKSRAKRENAKVPVLPTLEDLLRDDIKFDPFGIKNEEITATVSGTEEVSGAMVRGKSLMDKLMENVVDLPKFEQRAGLDLAEFENTLRQTLQASLESWQPQIKNVPLDGVLGGLILQAVVMSPNKYVILNGERYREGDGFKVQIPVMVPDNWILSALENKMPDEKLVGPELMENYQTIFESVVADFAQQRNANPMLGQKMMILPVKLVQILPRTVLLEADGRRYELQVKFAY
ncbi:MAG: hypothetical protein EBQ80_04425 [Proteobacteria bacterium]|nr:hypothetical protein [Pseudomonadota bacterium]